MAQAQRPSGRPGPEPQASGCAADFGGFGRPFPSYICLDLSPQPLDIRRSLLKVRQQFAPTAGEEVAGRLELVLAEVLNNIAEHGGAPAASDPTKIHVSAATAEGGIYCIVSDVGEALPPSCLERRPLPQTRSSEAPDTDLPEGGFGWFMIQHLASKLYYGREGRRNVLAFLIPDDHPVVAA